MAGLDLIDPLTHRYCRLRQRTKPQRFPVAKAELVLAVGRDFATFRVSQHEHTTSLEAAVLMVF